MYKLIPQPGHITVAPLKTGEIKEYTGKLLNDVETTGMDVLQYGRVILVPETSPGFEFMYKTGDIVVYPKLASDKTNFGDPRQVIVEVGHVKAHLEEIK